MPLVYIANTNFEFELNQNFSKSIQESWAKNPFCLQLQFLPLLFASAEDKIAVTQLPKSNFLENLKSILKVELLPQPINLQEFTPFHSLKCLSWGPSKQVQMWAEQRKMEYLMPSDWSMIQKLNSKAFSFRYCPFNEACLIQNPTSLTQWLKQSPFPKVLKTCFGLSGIGHLIVDETTDLNRIMNFCNIEWSINQPVIGEPWVKRIFDFSTQWSLLPDGTFELFGSTVFQTRTNGRYLGTFAGSEEEIFAGYLPFLKQHIEIVKNVLKDLASYGYFGHIGVDALLYWCDEEKKVKLYPVVEINARQTLSFVALRLQQIYYPNQILHLSFQKSPSPSHSLLPASLGSLNFSQNLSLKLLPNLKNSEIFKFNNRQ